MLMMDIVRKLKCTRIREVRVRVVRQVNEDRGRRIPDRRLRIRGIVRVTTKECWPCVKSAIHKRPGVGYAWERHV